MPTKLKPIAKIFGMPVYHLTKELAAQHQKELLGLMRLIPKTKYKLSDVLAESKPGRTFYGKWEHSLVVFKGKKLVAMLVAYEREKEGGKLYRRNTLYISELAVDKKFQGRGVGSKLLRVFKWHERFTKFKHLKGKWNISVQTNIAEWNQPIKKMYELEGFFEVGKKIYPNRVDVVLRYPERPDIEWIR